MKCPYKTDLAPSGCDLIHDKAGVLYILSRAVCEEVEADADPHALFKCPVYSQYYWMNNDKPEPPEKHDNHDAVFE